MKSVNMRSPLSILALTTTWIALPLTLVHAESTAQPAPSEQAKGAATSIAVPVYKPPVRGAPGGRVGGGTRGKDQTFTISVLAPNHTGLTVKEQPVLYWYLSKPISVPIVFTLTDDGSNPVIEQLLNPPFDAGVQRLQLADFGVRLLPGKQYRWFVSLVPDPQRRSKDILAGATIERTELHGALASKVEQANSLEVARSFAEEGYWYDALAKLSESLDKNPSDAGSRSARAALLQQIGLSEIAEYDMTQKQ